ncbi:MAG: hypothetical protein A2161_15290 [Candidatus Schekmanbacteria bacterium RBG_13_48_7]|uniref:Response regulatory domain-containing protein n=1 Tax=Candidatus Schekmanbacteria bacterium RBG_13_48_7 TaxID=1817878 RepID=A0A1F7RMF3_9BACT|nr:MAG: hypothetical protein A2161_15290 [Candidatus Schekmanbacteria bacterium RBG_13_48_7]
MEKSKILIVEDSETMRHLVSFALKRLSNTEIVEANDGSDAIKKFRREHFDLVITDLMMPHIDGFKLIQFIRNQQDNARIPIIIVSTRYSPEDRERGFSLGANAYISKPIHSGTLLQAVQNLLKDHNTSILHKSIEKEG